MTLLAVASQPLLAHVRRIVAHTRWSLLEAGLLDEAMRLLPQHPAMVFLCDAQLPDGTWREMLAHAARLPLPPPVIVAAGHADDRLWMEVLNGGAYNLIGTPLDDQELYQLVSRAWLHRRNCQQAHAG